MIIDACELRPKDSKEKPIIILFPSTNEKRAWLKEVKMLVKEFQKKEAQAAKEKKLKAMEGASLGTTPQNNNYSNNNLDLSNDSKSGGRITHSNSATSLSHSSSSNSLKDQTNGAKQMAQRAPNSGGKMNSSSNSPIVPPPLRKAATSSSLFGGNKEKKKEKDVIKPKKGSSVVPSKSNTQKYKKELVKTLAKKN